MVDEITAICKEINVPFVFQLLKRKRKRSELDDEMMKTLTDKEEEEQDEVSNATMISIVDNEEFEKAVEKKEDVVDEKKEDEHDGVAKEEVDEVIKMNDVVVDKIITTPSLEATTSKYDQLGEVHEKDDVHDVEDHHLDSDVDSSTMVLVDRCEMEHMDEEDRRIMEEEEELCNTC